MLLLPFTSAMTYAQLLDGSSAGPAILASDVSEMSDHSGASLQEIKPSPEGHGRTVSMGEFVRDVFLEQVSVAAINLPARSAFQCQLFRVMHVHAPSCAAKVVSEPFPGKHIIMGSDCLSFICRSGMFPIPCSDLLGMHGCFALGAGCAICTPVQRPARICLQSAECSIRLVCSASLCISFSCQQHDGLLADSTGLAADMQVVWVCAVLL